MLRLRFVFLSVLILTFLDTGSVRAATFFVGTGPGCTHPTLPAAIAAANLNGTAFDRIYLTENQSFAGPLVISGHVQILGGTIACGSLDRSGRTRVSILSGGGLSIGSYLADIDSIDFVHLAASGDNDRLINASGAFSLYLRGVSLRNGRARWGGNLHLSGTSGSQATLENVVIERGTATESGGGIYCQGPVQMTWAGGVDILNNQALNGGGVGMGGGCRLNASANLFPNGPVFIRSNTASMAGGGIYLSDFAPARAAAAATATLTGGATHHSAVYYNQARVGAGAYLSSFDSPDTRLNLLNTWVLGNTASTSGGGVYALGRSVVLIDRSGTACHTPAACSAVVWNSATGTQPAPPGFFIPTGQGGAFFLDGAARLTVRQTFVEHSHSANGGSVLAAEGFGAAIDMEGVVLYANSGSATAAALRVSGDSTLRLAFVSSAGNLTDAAHRLVSSSGRTEIYSSVFGETRPGVISSVGTGSVIDCVIVPRRSALPIAGSGVTEVTDPALLFVDPAGGNLHLRSGSPAIDYCDNYFYTPSDPDVDTHPRGIDHPAHSNYIGFYDLGADEVRP